MWQSGDWDRWEILRASGGWMESGKSGELLEMQGAGEVRSVWKQGQRVRLSNIKTTEAYQGMTWHFNLE